MNPIAFVFMIIAMVVLIVGAIALGVSLLSGSNVSAASQDIMTIVSNAQEVFGAQGDYAGISGSEDSVIPKTMQGSTPIGGTFALSSAGQGLPSSQFELEMSGLSLNTSTCEKLVSEVDDISTDVNGTAVGNADETPTGAQASAACKGGDITSLGFVFGNSQ